MMDAFEMIATRPQLNIIFLVNSSSSMSGERIRQLNEFMSEAIPAVEETAAEREVSLRMRVAEINTAARWIYGDTVNGVEHIEWMPLEADGEADTSGALELAKSVMRREILGEKISRPIVILVSDGSSGDPQKTASAIDQLKTSLRGLTGLNEELVIRIVVEVDGANRDALIEFASAGTVERDDVMMGTEGFLLLSCKDIGLLKNAIKLTISPYMWMKYDVLVDYGFLGDETVLWRKDDSIVAAWDESGDDDWEE